MRRALLAALAVSAVAPGAAQAAYADDVRAIPGVVHHWTLDDAAAPFAANVGTTTLRVSNSGGFTVGQPAGVEVGGTSLTLAGGAFITSGSATTATGRTVEAWVSPSTVTGNRYIVSRGSGTGAGTWQLFLQNGKPAFQVSTKAAIGPTALTANRWVHLAGTLSGTTLSVYVDGVLQDTDQLTAAQATHTQNLYAGRPAASSWSGYRYRGGLDELAVYDRGLSAAEVLDRFRAGLDPTPWAIVFSGGPPAVSDRPDGSVTFAATRGGVSFQCALDDLPAAPCAGSYDYDLLRDGAHSLRVDAVRRGSAQSATYSWQVALPASELAPPRTTFGSAPPALTNSTTATFAIGGSKSELAFECRLDGGAWATCPANGTFSRLAAGSHTLEARATDRWGAVEESPIAHRWTIDLTPPDTFVLAAKARRADPGSVVLGSEAGTTFQCRPAEGAWVPCDRSFALPVMTIAGQMDVRAVDAAGNGDPTPATILLEPAPQDATIAFSGASASFVVGGVRDAGALLCSLDGAPAARCATPLVFDGLAYGRHALTITDPNMPGVVFPTLEWTDPLPAPKIVGSQFPAVLQLGSRRKQASLATSRLPRMLFQSNSAGVATVELRRGRRVVRRWKARVVQGSNLVRLPRSAWRKLRPGRYRLEVVVKNASGASTPLALRFDAVRSTRR